MRSTIYETCSCNMCNCNITNYRLCERCFVCAIYMSVFHRRSIDSEPCGKRICLGIDNCVARELRTTRQYLFFDTFARNVLRERGCLWLLLQHTNTSPLIYTTLAQHACAMRSYMYIYETNPGERVCRRWMMMRFTMCRA